MGRREIKEQLIIQTVYHIICQAHLIDGREWLQEELVPWCLLMRLLMEAAV